MLIKVCGMRDAQNIKAVSRLGVDFIGLIFFAASPRDVEAGTNIDFDNLKKLAVRRVGVFVNADVDFIAERVVKYGLDCVQLHGSEPASFCMSLRQTDAMRNTLIFKAINIGSVADLRQCAEYENDVDMFVFDTKSKLVGGNGQQFDWNVLDSYSAATPYLLSGGIGPADAWRVSAFVDAHKQCAGIDLNSKFETEPAVKNIEILQQFINEVKSTSNQL